MEQAIVGCPRTVDPKPVSMSRMYVRNKPVMDEASHLREPEACFMPEVIEETEFNALGVFSVHGEVCT
jgi:hypothetical protein